MSKQKTRKDKAGPQASTQAIGSLALPGFADPEQIVTMSREQARKAIARQLKFHLLTTERIVMSDGFLFDNPALWLLLSADGQLQECLLSKKNPALAILTSDVAARRSIDERFRMWLFRPDGTTVNSSAARTTWAAIDGKHSPASEDLLKRRNSLTLKAYASDAGFEDLSSAEGAISAMLTDGVLLAKPKNRHERFGDEVRGLIRLGSTIVSPGIPAADWADFVAYAGENQQISRSKLAVALPNVWKHASLPLNIARMETTLQQVASDSRASCWYTLPNIRRRTWQRVDQTAFAAPDKSPWVLSLDQLTFEDVRSLREDSQLRGSITGLARTGMGRSKEAHLEAVELWAVSLAEAAERLKLSNRRVRGKRTNDLATLSTACNVFTEVVKVATTVFAFLKGGPAGAATSAVLAEKTTDAAKFAQQSLSLAEKFSIKTIGEGLQLMSKEVVRQTEADVYLLPGARPAS